MCCFLGHHLHEDRMTLYTAHFCQCEIENDHRFVSYQPWIMRQRKFILLRFLSQQSWKYYDVSLVFNVTITTISTVTVDAIFEELVLKKSMCA